MTTDPTIFKQIAGRVLGDAARKLIVVVSAWLAAKGVGALDAGTQTNLVEVITGGVGVLVSMGWSYWRSRGKDQTINALANQVVDNGATPLDHKGDIVTVLPSPK